MSGLNLSLSMDEILFAAILGLILTWLVQHVIKFKKLLDSISVDLGYTSEDLNKILQKCYKMFPTEKFLFNGETYLRGAKIRVTTLQKKIFEGELIGVNNKNMICIMTNKHIIAHEIKNIENITAVEK